MMFSELRYEKYLCCTFGPGSLASKDAIARTYRKKRLVCAVSAHGRLRGESGESEFILYSKLQQNLFFRNICLDVYRHNQLMPWQQINKLKPERSTKSER